MVKRKDTIPRPAPPPLLSSDEKLGYFLFVPAVAVARPEQTSLAITAIIRTIVYANEFVLAYECLLLSI